ncbi:glycosyltransferase family 2 protein [Streptomyces sp. NP160]|uniref:glycosyltransferase family 2 protein n=1 Tax=Streptomyces sp. NP160 TaxID=2586637 RepID=UPI001118E503|nr:glycosyltransferase family 2 protein [Streptomyces sp. NP160]TNM66976.1 glycosyltransferase family 2 protein [Streptomyces sp. NP160]
MSVPQPPGGGVRVDVVLPCLDEAGALPGVLAELAALGPEYSAVVVDNGSTDGTAEVARAAGARVVVQPVRGFGSACHAGLEAATAPLVAFCDADGSLDLGELPRLVALVDAGAADLVLGRRRATSRSAWPLHARVAGAALSVLVRMRLGLRLHDLGPMRVARRADLLALDLRDRRSGYPLEAVARAVRAGLRVAEVDVAYRPRTGRSKVTGTVRGTVGAVRDMSRVLAAAEGGRR